MGYVHGLPVGLSFIGPAWSEARLMALGAAFEHAATARKPPAYLPSVESQPDITAALSPLAH
jgi:amidase